MRERRPACRCHGRCREPRAATVVLARWPQRSRRPSRTCYRAPGGALLQTLAGPARDRPARPARTRRCLGSSRSASSAATSAIRARGPGAHEHAHHRRGRARCSSDRSSSARRCCRAWACRLSRRWPRPRRRRLPRAAWPPPPPSCSPISRASPASPSKGDEAASDCSTVTTARSARSCAAAAAGSSSASGDGLLLTFPEPEAAVLCCLELVEAAPAPLRLRAGVHLGDVSRHPRRRDRPRRERGRPRCESAWGGEVLATTRRASRRRRRRPPRSLSAGPAAGASRGSRKPINVCVGSRGPAVTW